MRIHKTLPTSQLPPEEILAAYASRKKEVKSLYQLTPEDMDQFRVLESAALQLFLNTSQTYNKLNQLLSSTNLNEQSLEIAKLVKTLRTEVTEKGFMYRENIQDVFYDWVNVFNYLKTITSTKTPKPEYAESKLVEFPEQADPANNKIYHWTRTKNVAPILAKGLLPSFCLGSSPAPFVYTSMEPFANLGEMLARQRDQNMRDYKLLEITVDSAQMEIYFSIPVVVDQSGFSTEYTYYKYPYVLSAGRMSSKLVPLHIYEAALLNMDIKYAEAKYAAGFLPQKHTTDVNETGWFYSDTLKMKIPHGAATDPQRVEFEVLADYVPPKNIKQINT